MNALAFVGSKPVLIKCGRVDTEAEQKRYGLPKD